MRQLSPETQEALKQAIEGMDPVEAETFIVKMIAKDFYLYLERNLMIKDKVTGVIIPFELNWAQERFVEVVLKDLMDGVPVRYIILKARQMGISTVIEGLCYWWTATHRNIKSVIMAFEKDASNNLYEMFRRFYQNSHPAFQPALKYNTKNDMTFDVEDEVKNEAAKSGMPVPGLGSAILTMVAKDNKGRSGTNHFFHGSEVAFWEQSADLVSSVLQTIPLAPKTFAFLESTANGVGTYFFNTWMDAEKGEGAFKPFFLAWHDHAEYEHDEELGYGPYSEYEDELIELFDKKGLDRATQCRKIAWARRKQLDFKNEPKKFFQEYPHTPMSAFLASGNYAFPTEILMQMQDAARADTTMKYAELATNDKRETTHKFVEISPLKIWELPQKGEKYVIGGDIAEGIVVSAATGKEGDYSVATVMEIGTGRVVARWRGHIDPDQFGDVLFDLGTFYNMALIGPEINNHGIVTMQKLINRFYRNLFRRENSAEHQFQEPTALMGWKTDRATKPRIIKNLAAAIRERWVTDLDPVFIGEALTYMQNERGIYDGKANGHDDCVMSMAIALELADWSSNDVEYAKQHINKSSTKIKQHGTKADESSDDRLKSVRANRRKQRTSRKR